MSKLKKYKLDKLYKINSGISTKSEQYGNGSPFVSFSTIFNNYFLPDELPELMETSEQEQKTYSVKKGDVFLTRTSETLDELAMSSVAIKDYPKATFSGFAKRLRPIQEDITYDKYMGFFLRSKYFRKIIDNNAIMTLRASFNEAIFSYINIYLPDYNQQVKIGNLLYKIEEKIKLNNKINAELENIAKDLYDYWFVQFDFPDENARPYKSSGGNMVYNNILKKEIPEIFNIKTLQDIVQISTEQIIPQKGVKYNYYSIPTYDEIKTYQIEDGVNIQSNKFIVQNNDVLISKLNPRFNRVIGVQNITNGISSTELIVFRCLTKELQSLIYNIAKSDHFKQYCIYNATGSSGSHNRIAPEIMSAYKIPYNDEVINKFNKLIVPLTQKQMQIIQETRELISLREFLLPMLMNGQVTVSDKIENNLSEEKIIEKSLEFWKTHGKMDIDKFARENGILVYKDNEQKKGAVSYNAEKDLYEIAVKDPRDNFTIAHEIGHILKHKKELKTGTLGRKSEESGSKIMEYEADFLAAEILMPEEYVMKYLKEYNISNKDYLDEKLVRSCAKNFDVTPPAMNIRLKNLGYKVPYLK